MTPNDEASRVDDFDVAIVGAGPVGLVLGILLAQRDHSVVILEQFPQPYPLPRAVHFDHEVGRILQGCGIGDRLRAVSEPADIYEWRSADGATLLRFGRSGPAASGWPASSMFSQPDLEALLTERAGELPGLEIRRARRVVSIQDADTVRPDRVAVGTVAVEYDTDPAARQLHEVAGGASTLTARQVVGCDGANSSVRRLLGIDMDDRGFFYDWLIVDVLLNEPRVYDPINVQICDPDRPTTAVSGGPGRRRWEFMRLPHESIDDLNRSDRAWELLADWDVHPGNARLERHAVYTFQARIAERWRSGRALLAGDAAHQMPPFAGQGLCAGVRDAMNLAWKLDLVLRGLAPGGVLDTYDSERRPGASAAVDFSIELGKVICVPDPAEAAARDEMMSAAYDGSVSAVPPTPGIDQGFIADDPTSGSLLPQSETAEGLFDDVHGIGWRLVTIDDTLLPSGQEVDWFESIGGRVVHLGARSGADDFDRRLDTWFAAHDCRWVLQRPDFHCYGTATDAAGAGELLGAMRSHLTRMTPSMEETP